MVCDRCAVLCTEVQDYYWQAFKGETGNSDVCASACTMAGVRLPWATHTLWHVLLDSFSIHPMRAAAHNFLSAQRM